MFLQHKYQPHTKQGVLNASTAHLGQQQSLQEWCWVAGSSQTDLIPWFWEGTGGVGQHPRFPKDLNSKKGPGMKLQQGQHPQTVPSHRLFSPKLV